MAEHEETRAGRIAFTVLVIGLLAAVTGPGTAYAQESDERWLAWMGCWQPVGEAAARGAPDALVCFQPLAGDVGVEMVSLEDGEIVARETVRADGRRHDANLEGCAGWDRGDFSARPGRVFLASEHLCDGGVVRAESNSKAKWYFLAWLLRDAATQRRAHPRGCS